MADTWNDPGLCSKCANSYSSIRWVHTGVESGVSVGYLRATCKRCGYQWNIASADETP